METVASQSSITLVIKAPNQRVKDIEVSCLLDWTVEKLKTHLANVYPTKPARNSQKIIYSGKLLDDHFVLKDILQESGGTHQTVHLVCAPTTLDAPQSAPSPAVREPPPTTQATVPEVSTPMEATTQPDGLRQRHQHAYPQHPFYNMYNTYPAAFTRNGQQQVTTNAAGAQFPPGQPYLPPNAHHFGHHGAHYAAQQMAYMQWMQHMAQAMHGVPYMPMQPPLPYSQQTVGPHQVNAPAAAQAPQAQERPENRPQNRNMVMNANAGGGMMQDEDNDDEENVQRDWLDYIYMAVRIFMLMSIFWFYSSAERLILMGVAIFVIWMLQSGWFNLRRAQRNRHPDVQPNAENNVEVPQEQEGGVNDEDGGGSESGETGDSDETEVNTTTDSNDVQQQPDHPGFLVVTFNFVTTFFTSLIPQSHRVA